MGSLSGRAAVVAGGSGGFGAAIAARLIEDGARVVVAARNEERLKETADGLGASRPSAGVSRPSAGVSRPSAGASRPSAGAIGIACDLTRSGEVAELAGRTVEELGQLDIAVNSAGYEDVVNAVSWLASDASSYITGQNIHVDGGTSLRRLPRAEDFLRSAQTASND